MLIAALTYKRCVSIAGGEHVPSQKCGADTRLPFVLRKGGRLEKLKDRCNPDREFPNAPALHVP